MPSKFSLNPHYRVTERESFDGREMRRGGVVQVPPRRQIGGDTGSPIFHDSAKLIF